MNRRDDLLGAGTALGLLTLSILVDKATYALRLYAGRTFQFQLPMGAYLVFSLLMSLLSLLFGYLLIFRLRPAYWVFILSIGLSLLLLLPFVFSYLLPFNAFFEFFPAGFRTQALLLITPVTFTSMVTATLFWTGLIGLWRAQRAGA